MPTMDLRAVLTQMLIDLQDHDCYYWLYTNYFDILPPTERTVTRWYMTPLFINYDALRNPLVQDDSLVLEVILKNQLPAQWERIRISFEQLYSIVRVHTQQPTGEPSLYHDAAKINFSRGSDPPSAA